jgi:hypothetical protein
MGNSRRANWRRIKRNRSYTTDDAAKALRKAKGTVRRWLKGGLPSLQDQRPALILGDDLIAFLKDRRQPKQRCRLDECFCFKCRAPRRPAFGEVEYWPMNATGGRISALCAECTTVMSKRISWAAVDELKTTLRVTIRQADERISNRA